MGAFGDNASLVADNPEAISESIVPVMDRHSKSRYIALRACGFTIREAAQLVPISEVTIRDWRRTDPEFLNAENNIAEYRDQLSKEHLNLEFTRNYALVLHKDFQILQKSMQDPDTLSSKETAYLLRARSHYTPQQLSILQQLLGGKPSNLGESFTEFVVRMSKKEEVLTIEGKRG